MNINIRNTGSLDNKNTNNNNPIWKISSWVKTEVELLTEKQEVSSENTFSIIEQKLAKLFWLNSKKRKLLKNDNNSEKITIDSELNKINKLH